VFFITPTPHHTSGHNPDAPTPPRTTHPHHTSGCTHSTSLHSAPHIRTQPGRLHPSWYDEERLKQEVVESSSGPCMNQHVAPSGVTHLSPAHKDRLSDELRNILEAWHGAPLSLTSIYGIRYGTALLIAVCVLLFLLVLLMVMVMMIMK
jgi:hypothetical protein